MNLVYELLSRFDPDPKNSKWELSQLPPRRHPDVLLEALRMAVSSTIPHYDDHDLEVETTVMTYIEDAVAKLCPEKEEL